MKRRSSSRSVDLIPGYDPAATAGGCWFDDKAAGNLRPSKKKGTDRIDGIVAGVMALGRAIVAGPEKRSVYETRGVIALEW